MQPLYLLLKNFFGSSISFFTDTATKIAGVYNAVVSVRSVGLQLLKTGESILSKIGLSGVSVSCLTSAGFFTLLYSGVGKLMSALQAIDSGLSSSASGSSGGVVAVANYYLPVDVIAICILLYISVWMGVSTFKFWCRMLSFFNFAKSSHSRG